MSAEIICVGTELLLGDILNGNARYLAQQLAILGIPHHFQTVVGDNKTRLKQVIEIALSRAQILIFTGGLGPTPDDLTCEAIAEYFHAPLIENPAIIDDIATKFAARGRVMVASNRKQALIPQGANILPNRTGTAPGIIWSPQPNLHILTFPGVPSEMHQMWKDTAVPYLKSQGWGTETIYSRNLRFWGIGESTLAEKVAPYFDLTNPTVAPYAGKGEVRLRISAKTTTPVAAAALIDPVAAEIAKIAGIDFYGVDDDNLASVVGSLLQQQGQTLSVAESCTGGGLGQMLTEMSGSSEYFWGGIISYDNSVKIKQLGVKPDDINNWGAVSSQVAQAMAIGVKTRLETDWGLSITGIAGPNGGTESKPVGLVYIGLAAPNGNIIAQEHRFGSNRDRELIRFLSANAALDLLRREILKK